VKYGCKLGKVCDTGTVGMDAEVLELVALKGLKTAWIEAVSGVGAFAWTSRVVVLPFMVVRW
jgi:hypothetical protein